MLVATTVIEVGVDVPGDDHDRPGGRPLRARPAPPAARAGRPWVRQSYLLISRAKEELTDAAQARLEALVRTTDGFELAEVDLGATRGEGQLLGTRRAGLSEFRFATPSRRP